MFNNTKDCIYSQVCLSLSPSAYKQLGEKINLHELWTAEYTEEYKGWRLFCWRDTCFDYPTEDTILKGISELPEDQFHIVLIDCYDIVDEWGGESDEDPFCIEVSKKINSYVCGA